ncbi:hypothetical protein CSC71_14765 [Pseudoxanthomonas sangjuensis]|uniref:hypothetical protein n=1 Tax=Pseudoxanthomonas sangjuensis TaxID=1503750 RepID=UPI001390E8A9|nr:hypothetical protein [Pseudoxanthomonas sangjuensis]KAF1706025.1 hypothetical protein CSC71_14765 [Pseudoxanthomonas sangjuensis]
MGSPLKFEQFLDATCNILDEDGFVAYLPTLYVNDEILVVEGIPDSVSDTDALNNVGSEYGLGSSGTFFAVLAAADTVVAGEFSFTGWRFAQIQPGNSGLVISWVERPLWFRL